MKPDTHRFLINCASSVMILYHDVLYRGPLLSVEMILRSVHSNSAYPFSFNQSISSSTSTLEGTERSMLSVWYVVITTCVNERQRRRGGPTNSVRTSFSRSSRAVFSLSLPCWICTEKISLVFVSNSSFH